MALLLPEPKLCLTVCLAAERHGLDCSILSWRPDANAIAQAAATAEVECVVVASSLAAVGAALEGDPRVDSEPLYLDTGGKPVATCFRLGHAATSSQRELPLSGESIAADAITPTTDGRSVYLLNRPLYQPMSLALALHCLRRDGGEIVLAEPFDAQRVLAALEAYGITHTYWTPGMVVRLLKLAHREAFDISSLRSVCLDGWPCPRWAKAELIEWIGPVVDEHYQPTTSNAFVSISAGDWLLHRGSVGIAPHRTEIRAGDGQALARGEPGSIHLPDANGNLVDAGDRGFIDAEGYLHVTDRTDQAIGTGNVTVYPHEVEEVLLQHERVREAVVVGAPDEEAGSIPVALVELDDASAGNAILGIELIDFCRARLSAIKCPQRVMFVDSIPCDDRSSRRGFALDYSVPSRLAGEY